MLHGTWQAAEPASTSKADWGSPAVQWYPTGASPSIETGFPGMIPARGGTQSPTPRPVGELAPRPMGRYPSGFVTRVMVCRAMTSGWLIDFTRIS